tara:strand:+ start:15333 stop:15551 length:219 start_codon:yes stop_codon:yes gene_type:complete
MNSDKNIDIAFKKQFVEVKFLINDGETLGDLDNFYLTRNMSYPQWESLAQKLKLTIKDFENNKNNLDYYKNE